MQSQPPCVVVLGTGGTIAGMAGSANETLRYDSAQLGIETLVAAAPLATAVAIEAEQVAQLDSKDMDFATWRRLALAAARQRARPEVAGVVVTHGTDTLEETAYFLARVLGAGKPVVLTGAMRPATAREADGPRNLADAIAVAAAAPRRVDGVVVVFAGSIHAARDVCKRHPQRPDAFTSGERGALGSVAGAAITIARASEAPAVALGVDALAADAAEWPWVEIVTSVAGADGRSVDRLADAGVDGIVVAATGNGSVHRCLVDALARAQARGVRVLRSTRTLDGAIVGGSPSPFASAGDLTPVKARVELILELLRARS